jgi:hypothetical protein
MSDPMKQAWSEVGDEFSSLGRLMKDRYQAAGSDAEAAVDDSTKAAGAALRDAWDRLVSAAKEVGDRTADVARDDELRDEAKRAAGKLNDALSATVDLIGDRVGGLFKRSDDIAETPTPPAPPGPAGEVPASAPTSDDARQ